MIRKASAVVRLKFPSEEETKIVHAAIKPETETLRGRSRVQIAMEGRDLTLVFEAKDTTALRASLNSYLSWIALLRDLCKTLNLNQKRRISKDPLRKES